jgi:hypothetical protein
LNSENETAEVDTVLAQDQDQNGTREETQEEKKEREERTKEIPNAAVCILVEFVLPEGKELANPLNITVFEEDLVHTNESIAQFYQEAMYAGGEERDKSGKIIITDGMLWCLGNGTFTFDASLWMVRLLGTNTLEDGSKESEAIYVGCEIFCSGQKIYSFKSFIFLLRCFQRMRQK